MEKGGPFQRSRIYEHCNKGEPVHIIIIFIARNKCFCYSYENAAIEMKREKKKGGKKRIKKKREKKKREEASIE